MDLSVHILFFFIQQTKKKTKKKKRVGQLLSVSSLFINTTYPHATRSSLRLTSNRSINKPRIQSRQILIPKPHPRKLAWDVILNQNITLLDQIPNQLLASLRPDIDSDGFLVPVDAEKVGALGFGSVWVCGKGRAPSASVVSPLWVLYFDHFRANPWRRMREEVRNHETRFAKKTTTTEVVGV